MFVSQRDALCGAFVFVHTPHINRTPAAGGLAATAVVFWMSKLTRADSVRVG